MASIHTIPLHLGDLITDTVHLTAAELGAYMRLLSFHYRTGRSGIPDDDTQLRRITGLDNKTWRASRETILNFFEQDGDRRWIHRRVQKTLDGITAVQEQNRAKALKRWKPDDAVALPEQCNGNATAMQSISQKPEAIDSVARATSSPRAPKRKRVTLDELSVDHIATWLAKKRGEGKYTAHDEHFILEFFKSQCQAKGYKYDDYVHAYRNAFEWERCQPRTRNGASQAGGVRAGTAEVTGGTGTPPQSSWLAEGDRLAAKYRAEAERERQGAVDPLPG